ncbi:unnamed protein product [Calicophoron daubneyi]|uniref:Adenomatous polyposis coli protein n=1 Tax=Calicophoron daubneyi TaxID=300641 RepID=A0AAV2TU10_CALDB
MNTRPRLPSSGGVSPVVPVYSRQQYQLPCPPGQSSGAYFQQRCVNSAQQQQQQLIRSGSQTRHLYQNLNLYPDQHSFPVANSSSSSHIRPRYPGAWYPGPDVRHSQTVVQPANHSVCLTTSERHTNAQYEHFRPVTYQQPVMRPTTQSPVQSHGAERYDVHMQNVYMSHARANSMERPKMQEPCQQDVSGSSMQQQPNKRNPPPPPPRSGSWLGSKNSIENPSDLRDSEINANSYVQFSRRPGVPPRLDRVQQQQQQQMTPAMPVNSSAAATTHPMLNGPCPQRYPPSYAAYTNLQAQRYFDGTKNPVSSGTNLSKVDSHIQRESTRTSQPVIPNQKMNTKESGTLSLRATTAACLTVRGDVTDALLRLLIRHYTTRSNGATDSSVSVNSDEKTALETLLHAVCNTGTCKANVTPASNVISLARRLLPHLIRIIYTEIVANDENKDDGTQSQGCETSTVLADPNGTQQPYGSDINSKDVGVTGSNRVVLSTESEFEMTASVDSKHSSGGEDEADLELEDEKDRELLESNEVDLTTTGELDALPPNTSMTELKNSAIEAMHRLVPMCQSEGSLRDRDMGILQLLATIHAYSTIQNARLNFIRNLRNSGLSGQPSEIHSTEPVPRCPVAEVAALVRLSFHPEHRTAICDLGGVHALIALLRSEHAVWMEPGLPLLQPGCGTESAQQSSAPFNQSTSPFIIITNGGKQNNSTIEHHLETSLALRRYICMALTNLTYGVAANKALLCRRLANLEALLAQLETGNEELKQVSASVLRNLSWRTDSRSKIALRRVHAPRRLTMAAMTAQRDSTLRTTLSALWNLSAHCAHNKRAVCGVDNVFAFLLRMMNCEDLASRLVIVENSGGILRNISSVAATREDYRNILNQNKCYPILVDLLRNSPSLTVVVNVCGTLWNLTAYPNCPLADHMTLCRLGVIDLLHRLAGSPHEMIKNSSLAVLRNLMQPTQQPEATNFAAATYQGSGANNQNRVNGESGRARSDQNGTMGQDLSCDQTAPISNTPVQYNNVRAGDSNNGPEDEDDDPNRQLSQSELLYRRRLNARSRFRFGLLSVVLEADDTDEEAEEQQTEEESEEEETDEQEQSEVSIYLDHEHSSPQEEIVIDESAVHNTSDSASDQIQFECLNSAKNAAYRSWSPPDDEPEEEQTCVYAEEGTPFPPDSAGASCLELNKTMLEMRTLHHTSRQVHPERSACSEPDDHSVQYASSDVVPQVYAVENSPAHNLSRENSPNRPQTVKNKITESRKNNQRTVDALVDEGPCLPSPPPDVSNLVSPLVSLNLDDEEGCANTGFQLPPPPCTSENAGSKAAKNKKTSTYSAAENDGESTIPTPLVFSRGTSSYLSSGDIGSSPVAFQSSPQSECSDQVVNHSIDDEDIDLDSSSRSKGLSTRPESVIEEQLPLLTYSNGDGAEEGNDGEEVRLPFAEEGTPQDAISLSDDLQQYGAPDTNYNRVQSVNTSLPCPMYGWHGKGGHSEEIDGVGHVDEVDDDDEHSQSQILQQCIASAMPPPLSATIVSAVKFSGNDVQSPLYVGTDDSVQAFAVEDTPFGTSTKASSFSDICASEPKSSSGGREGNQLSTVVHGHSLIHAPPSDLPKTYERTEQCSTGSGSPEQQSSSNSSSVNGDNSSDLLSEVIQSAMPKNGQAGLSTNCSLVAGPSDGDCLQLYAVEGTPGGDDLSGSSSLQNIDASDLNSLASQTSTHCLSSTSPAVAPTSSSNVSLETGVPFPPPPPRRTTSVLSNQRDPFAVVSTINRPQATVAPMPQVTRCSPENEPSDADSQLFYDTQKPPSQPPESVESSNTNAPDKDDASSFSSLLSIESVGLEHSLLQECISSAMPRPKNSNLLRKQQLWQQLRSSDFNNVGFNGTSPTERDETRALSPHVECYEEVHQLNENDADPKARREVSQSRFGLSVPLTQTPSSISARSLETNSAPVETTDNTHKSSQKRKSLSRSNGAHGAIHFLGHGSGGAPYQPPSFSPATTMKREKETQQPQLQGKNNVKQAAILGTAQRATKDIAPPDIGALNSINSSKSSKLAPHVRFGNGCPSDSAKQFPLSGCNGENAKLATPLGIPKTKKVTNGLRANSCDEKSSRAGGADEISQMLFEGAKAVLAELCSTSDETGNNLHEASPISPRSPDMGPSASNTPLATRKLSEGTPAHSQSSNGVGATSVTPSRPSGLVAPRIVAGPTYSSSSIPSRLIQPSRIVRPSPVCRSGASTPGKSYSGSSKLASPCIASPSTNKVTTTKYPVALSRGQSAQQIHESSGTPGASRRRRPSAPVVQPKILTVQSSLRSPTTRLVAPRSAMTCPPSAGDRSLASSRSISAASSVASLVSNPNRSGVQKRSQPVSAKSVRAALVKHERTTSIATKKPMSSSTALNKKTAPRTTTVGIRNISQSNVPTVKTSEPSAHTAIPSVRPSSTSSSTHHPTDSASSDSLSCPKPIRGGRKSLTGRKPNPTASDGEIYSHVNAVKPIPAAKSCFRSHDSAQSSTDPTTRSDLDTKQTGISPSVPDTVNDQGRSHKAIHQTSETLLLSTEKCEVSPGITSKSPGATSHRSVEDAETGEMEEEETKRYSDSSGMWIVRGELGLVDS